jgi:nucleotide-binding universal stress UspA family protein
VGEAILDTAKEVDADLIVKGAYTHSRLRQLVFGGATRHLLHNTPIALFMAH